MIGAACSGVTKRGVPSTKMKPSASAPASTASRASSGLVIPQILTLVTERQLPDLGGHVAGPHESLADEDGVRARRHYGAHLRGGEKAALAHHDWPGRDQRKQLECRLHSRLERVQVAVVDPE